MFPDLLKALLGIGAILGLWLLVQRWFRRASGLAADADPLAGHVRCHGCTCDQACDKAGPSPKPHPTR